MHACVCVRARAPVLLLQNRCLTDGGHEDKEVARCLQTVGVATHNTRDRFGRNTFHPLSPREHIVGPVPEVRRQQMAVSAGA